MVNINFVPEDYIQNNESNRTNLIYLVLFLAVMSTLVGTFITIKVRQRALIAQEALVNIKLVQAKEEIKKFEELQTKFKIMSKTALTTAELLEPVPRSVLLASLTNNLPPGVSLLRLNFVQKSPKRTGRSRASNRYKKTQAKKAAAGQSKVSAEKQVKTYIDITGVAPSDLEVAGYIESLTGSALLDNVALVESKEYKIEDMELRQFKLTAMLRKNLRLSEEDITRIRAEGGEVSRSFR